MLDQSRRGSAAGLPAISAFACLAALVGAPARAHHLVELTGLEATPLNGLISGLAHPVIGPDHLLFLLALSLLGLQRRTRWVLLLLAVGLAGSAVGLVLPGLPGAELLVAATLALVGGVLVGWLPALLLVPAMAIHGYVLSEAVLGWTPMPVLSYLGGLLVSQSLLLVLALGLLRPLCAQLNLALRRGFALALVGSSMLLALATELG
jgi:urease accessory protein